VPTCRRPALLRRALASIAGQEIIPAEVIVVDDSGTDLETTHAIAASADLPRVRAVANARTRGASGARNTGAALARLPLLGFLDDDDEWLPRYVAEALACLCRDRLDLVCAGFVNRLADGRERPGKNAPRRMQMEAFLVRNGGLRGSNFVIRRELFAAIGGFDESLPALNDNDLGVRLSLQPGLRYGAVDRPLVRYHVHDGERLSTPGSPARSAGVRRFYELHAARMGASGRRAYRAHVRRLWGVDEHGRPESSVAP
jgi:glycosyltransferase involved in cell wall biosynthesis